MKQQYYQSLRCTFLLIVLARTASTDYTATSFLFHTPEISIAQHFTRGSNIDEQYWKIVNQIATKQVTEIHPTLLYSEAYRELNRMVFFAINVIISSLDDIDIKDKIDPNALEEILTITHQELSVRAPTSLTGHDESLEKIQNCLNVFCSATDTPPTDFVHYSNKMNTLRLKELQ